MGTYQCIYMAWLCCWANEFCLRKCNAGYLLSCFIHTRKVKLADFGVAMRLNEAHADFQDVVGSPYWIAPEVIEMSAPTSACDIW
jgi:serine/threonine protein kinase